MDQLQKTHPDSTDERRTLLKAWNWDSRRGIHGSVAAGRADRGGRRLISEGHDY